MLLENVSLGFTWSLEIPYEANVRNRFMNDKVTTIFDHASKVYHTSNFDNQMKELRKFHKNAYRYLIEADVKKWSCIIQFDVIH